MSRLVRGSPGMVRDRPVERAMTMNPPVSSRRDDGRHYGWLATEDNRRSEEEFER
jgi:hypothetical protein